RGDGGVIARPVVAKLMAARELGGGFVEPVERGQDDRARQVGLRVGGGQRHGAVGGGQRFFRPPELVESERAQRVRTGIVRQAGGNRVGGGERRVVILGVLKDPEVGDRRVDVVGLERQRRLDGGEGLRIVGELAEGHGAADERCYVLR